MNSASESTPATTSACCSRRSVPRQRGRPQREADLCRGRRQGVILARAVFVRDYMARHTNPWNRALHLVGVPLAPDPLSSYFLARGRWLERPAAAFVARLHACSGSATASRATACGTRSRGCSSRRSSRPFRGSPEPPPAERAAPVSLVTGGSGFVGNRLARALVERGDRVRALVRDPAGAADLSALGVELVQGDMTDEASLRRAVDGVDRLFHTAGLVGDWLDRREAVRRQRRRNASLARGSRRGRCHPRRARELALGPRHEAPPRHRRGGSVRLRRRLHGHEDRQRAGGARVRRPTAGSRSS